MSKEVNGRISEVETSLRAELATIEQRRIDIKNMLGTFQYVRNGSAAEIAEQKPHGNSGRRLSVEARERIARAQRKRWALARKVERAKKMKVDRRFNSHRNSRASNAAQPPWNEKQDAVIMNAVKLSKEPVEATELARLLAGKLHRTPGAVRQRIHRLAVPGGMLKEIGNGTGSHHTVEVA